MKKLFFSALLSATVTLTAFATDTKSDSRIMGIFNREFSNASNVALTMKKSFADISFTQAGKTLHAYYDLSGSLIGTSSSINVDDLPTNAKRTFAKRYEGYVVKEAMRFEATDEVAYYISAEKDNQAVVLKVDEAGLVSTFKKTKKG